MTERVRTSEDQPAGLDDVRRAVEELSLADLTRIRKYACALSRPATRSDRGWDAEDLLQEAIGATLGGDRHWFPTRVDFVGHLVGAVRSIAWNWHRSAAVATVVALDPDDGAEGSAHEAPAPSPERIALAKKELDEITRLLEGDRLATAVVDCWADGLTGPETWAALGITELDYRAFVRRLRRRLRHLEVT